MKISTLLAIERFVNDSVYSHQPDTQYVILLNQEPKAPRGLFSKYWRPRHKSIDISVSSEGLIYTVDHIEKKHEKKTGLIPYSFFSTPFIEPINQAQLDAHRSEILYCIEQNKHINPRYSDVKTKRALEAHHDLNSFLKGVDDEEKKRLDQLEIDLFGEKKRFRDIIREAPICWATAGKWLIAFLAKNSPTFKDEDDENPTIRKVVFTNEIVVVHNELLQKVYQQETPFEISNFDDTEREAEVLFVSLMTRPFFIYDIGYEVIILDAKNRLPEIVHPIFKRLSLASAPLSVDPVRLKMFCASYLKNSSAIIDPQQLSRDYVDIVYSIVRSKYRKLKNAYIRSETFRHYVQDVSEWLSSILDGSLFKNFKLYEPSFFNNFKLIADANLAWSDSAMHLFNNFIRSLLSLCSFEGNEKLKINIDFLKFLQQLNNDDFINFFRAYYSIDPQNIALLLCSYLICRGKRVDDDHLLASYSSVFNTELVVSNKNHTMFKPILTIMEKLIRHTLCLGLYNVSDSNTPLDLSDSNDIGIIPIWSVIPDDKLQRNGSIPSSLMLD